MTNKTRSLLLLTILIVTFSSNILISYAQTWSDDVRLTTHLESDWAPSVAAASDGKIWIVWHTYRTGNAEIYYNVHDGSGWLGDTQLTDNPSTDVLPSIMEAIDGKIWVVWASSRTGDFEIYYKTYDGSQWSTYERLTYYDTDEDKAPSIVQTSDGKIWIIWQSNRAGNDDLYYATSSDNGLNWTFYPSLTTSTDPDWQPSIMETNDGTVWVVWARSAEIFYKTYDGLSWATSTRLTFDEYFDLKPSVMQANDGIIWIIWQTDRNQPQDDIYYKIYDGISWSEDTRLTVDVSDDIMPSIAQTIDGTIWIVWATSRRDNMDIYYKTVSDFTLFHDIAIEYVLASSTSVYQGNTVYVLVKVVNEGTVSETFNVTAYYNGIVIENKTVAGLVPSSIYGGYIRLIYIWNTTDIALGYYTLSATADTVSGEIDTADNTLTGDVVRVKIPGDIDGDDIVDSGDAYFLSIAYGSVVGDPNYNPEADINGDGIIDIFDAIIIILNWTV